MQIYHHRQATYSQTLARWAFWFNAISIARVGAATSFGFLLYYYAQSAHTWQVVLMWVCVLVFVGLMKVHERVTRQLRLARALMRINKEELAYLTLQALPFEAGEEYENRAHAYSYDLDIFGKNSLFQHLNRTATYVGKEHLARMLLTLPPQETIEKRQAAIHELRDKVDWRQQVLALGRVHKDDHQIHQKLITWAKTSTKPLPTALKGLAYVLSAVFIGLAVMTWATGARAWLGLATLSFLVNLLVFALQGRALWRELAQSGHIDDALRQYSDILALAEQTPFESELMQAYQARLTCDKRAASQQARRLSEIFHRLESVQNVIPAMLFNGAFLYHVHALDALLRWKAKYAEQILVWLDVIGELEALNSLANFAYNRPDYTFPTLNKQHRLRFKALGHPLLSPTKSVRNDVDFAQSRFIILTGSNMSGKSTFLRTLGLNMVLAGIGAPVCAEQASVHPLPVWVSMRLADSLQDSESYFFAEVKRLREIIHALQGGACFVLLDEILRGTNSDDKRSGTIGVIKKLIGKETFGVIATHDIEVCDTTEDYPQMLTNRCFEAQIVGDELQFDYILREGVCKNKSATFLMEKMEIIDRVEVEH